MNIRAESIRIHPAMFVAASFFFLALAAVLLSFPRQSFGGGCGGTPDPVFPSAYKAGGAYPGVAGEDPVWARYAKRGQAFENCPELPLSHVYGFSQEGNKAAAPNVRTKRIAGKRAGVKTASRNKGPKQPAAKVPADQLASTLNPCPPILMPVPALPVCPDARADLSKAK